MPSAEQQFPVGTWYSKEITGECRGHVMQIEEATEDGNEFLVCWLDPDVEWREVER